MQVGLHNGCKMVVVVVSTFIVSSLVLGYKYRGAVINDTIPFPWHSRIKKVLCQ